MAFDKTKPAKTTSLAVSNPEILANNVALETAIGRDHDFTTGSTQTGKHKLVTMAEQSSPGASSSGEGYLYTKDSGTQAELNFTSEDGTEKQITADGQLNIVFADLSNVALDEDDFSSDSSSHVPTQQSTKAYIDGNTLGDSETDLSSKSWFLDEDDFASDDATKVASQQSIGAFIASSIAAAAEATYSGAESYSFLSGLTIKMGVQSVAGSTAGSITFGAAFGTLCKVVFCQILENTNLNNETVNVKTKATTGFSYYHYGSSTIQFMWAAIGY